MVMDLIVCTKKCNIYILSPIYTHTVNNFVFFRLIYNYSENSSKYEYKYEYKVASTSTSTSTQPSSTSTSTSTWNLYSSCTRVQVQVPSTTSLLTGSQDRLWIGYQRTDIQWISGKILEDTRKRKVMETI